VTLLDPSNFGLQFDSVHVHLCCLNKCVSRFKWTMADSDAEVELVRDSPVVRAHSHVIRETGHKQFSSLELAKSGGLSSRRW
jgi:hypothetical protein